MPELPVDEKTPFEEIGEYINKLHELQKIVEGNEIDIIWILEKRGWTCY